MMYFVSSVQVIEVLCQEPDQAAARQQLQTQFEAVDRLYEDLLNGDFEFVGVYNPDVLL